MTERVTDYAALAERLRAFAEVFGIPWGATLRESASALDALAAQQAGLAEIGTLLKTGGMNDAHFLAGAVRALVDINAAALPAQGEPDPMRMKALKLLNVMTSPHDPEFEGDRDHKWRECRHCLAMVEADEDGGQLLLRALYDELTTGRWSSKTGGKP
jgi:hypothetical protein